MQHISATQLRTKMPELIETLRQGSSVELLYRSQVLAEIRPITETKPKKSLKETLKFFKGLSPSSSGKNLTSEEARKIYRKHLEEKYG